MRALVCKRDVDRRTRTRDNAFGRRRRRRRRNSGIAFGRRRKSNAFGAKRGNAFGNFGRRGNAFGRRDNFGLGLGRRDTFGNFGRRRDNFGQLLIPVSLPVGVPHINIWGRCPVAHVDHLCTFSIALFNARGG